MVFKPTTPPLPVSHPRTTNLPQPTTTYHNKPNPTHTQLQTNSTYTTPKKPLQNMRPPMTSPHSSPQANVGSFSRFSPFVSVARSHLTISTSSLSFF
ncbi:hypothetical protein K402DRAFT_191419 [Aulographum hederae CBS 113979]|uniref:Uncharacterized protein n=1 Tax=Aulographum hederae CBS 113979 TaxID=1176131 RepID=A0A6G1GNT9_9PEZI|nr:hypothetical protein K402DRAFT_191419 [Aulographum hederae CBS 113979]